MLADMLTMIECVVRWGCGEKPLTPLWLVGYASVLFTLILRSQNLHISHFGFLTPNPISNLYLALDSNQEMRIHGNSSNYYILDFEKNCKTVILPFSATDLHQN